MAYQIRQREPLLDGYWQRMLTRRSIELCGLVMLLASGSLALILGSYSIDDPGWFTATNRPVQNWFGPTGALVASRLMVTLGYASWIIVAFTLIWGVRFTIHAGSFRFTHRAIYLPILILFTSVYAASLTKLPGWEHYFGMGGLFGDTVLAAILYSWPAEAAQAASIVKTASGIVVVALIIVAAGVSISEVRLILPIGRSRSETGAGETEPGMGLQKHVDNVSFVERHGQFGQGDESQLGKLFGVFSRKQSDAQEVHISHDEIAGAPTDPETGPGERERKAADGKSRRFLGKLGGRKADEPDVLPNERRFAEPSFSSKGSSRIDPPMRQTMPMFEDVAPERQVEKEHSRISIVEPPKKKKAKPSAKALREARDTLFSTKSKDYEGPPLSLLRQPDASERDVQCNMALEENARMLESVLDDYGVKGEIEAVRPGPVVTLYQLAPAPGLKTSRVMGLSDDIARSMSALSARISTVPGESYIGIELPNTSRETVFFREMVSRSEFGDTKKKLPIALGKNIGGDPVIVDLAKMPHLLIAGTTGSGKSVAINTMITSLLYKLAPEECRLIMVDPKMLELSVYEGIPHLLAPVVTDPKKAVAALKWVVAEMEERYRKMSKVGVRNIGGYNSRMKSAINRGEAFVREVQTGYDRESGEPIFEKEEIEAETLPYIVVVVDEMADLMMVAGKEIEACIQRLAQMARASGIHIIVATQRPSVDVITGVIKANFPTRISFQVSSKIDSRTILGEQGAEQLLGMGDMLYMANGGKIERVHGPFVSDSEVEQIVNYLKMQGEPDYETGIIDGPDGDKEADINLVLGLGKDRSSDDHEYDTAVSVVMNDRRVSISYIQRKMEIGYNKAARLVERMEEEGLISQANHVGKREILIPE